jgi:hypothetical protein
MVNYNSLFLWSMKKLLFILILSNVAYDQNPNILWQNTINAVDFDTFLAL